MNGITKRTRIRRLAGAHLLLATLLLSLGVSESRAEGRYLYLQSGNTAEGQNSIVAYRRGRDGDMNPLPGSPFLTGGTGINNSTNGKLGPNDNDTPIVKSADGKRLFAVNGHSNTIAVLDIDKHGSLRHVPGSPFPSGGIGPVSLAVAGDVLLVANRNEDPHQLDSLKGAARANYASFRIAKNGGLSLVSRVEIADGQKPTQILVSRRDPGRVLTNEFQVDVDFDGDGPVSRLFNDGPLVRGRLRTMRLDGQGRLVTVDTAVLPETATPAPDVPSIPLGIWDHPDRRLVYVGLVTRNELGVYRYDRSGKLEFVTAVPNSGQDICWIRVNDDGTRLYAVNNLPREDRMDDASTVTVFDVSGDRAEKPLEIQRVALPMPLGTFVNNRNAPQPNSTAFQLDIDPTGNTLCVLAQRIDQTGANTSEHGNILHVLRIDGRGHLAVVASRHLGPDGVHPTARPQGLVTLDS
ncbi:lactonase family protein [bacterium]|nr:lactonase family protein [bacterium]